eukprot:15364944-Ditylum_brightwellii.AAC.2
MPDTLRPLFSAILTARPTTSKASALYCGRAKMGIRSGGLVKEFLEYQYEVRKGSDAINQVDIA